MKLLVYSGNTWNGIWSHSHELAKNLAKHKKTIYLNVPSCQEKTHPNLGNNANYSIPKNLTVTKPEVSFEKFSLPYFIYVQLYTIYAFLKYRADIYFLYNTFDLPFFILAKLFGKKVHFMYVDDYPALAKSKFFKTLATIGTWLFLNFSDSVYCTAKVLEENAKQHNKKVHYTPNCVSLKDKKELKQKTRKEFIIGFVGTLGHWVDAQQLIDAAKKFKEDKILVVGGGEGYKLLEKAKLPNIELTGFVPHEKAYEYMSQFDIATIPFYINQITNAVSPVKLFEYWLAKKPVICAKTTELAQFEGTALFANNSEELIKQIKLLKENPEKRKQLAEKGYKLVKTKYNWDAMTKKYLKTL